MWPFKSAEKRSLENPQVPLSDANAWRQLMGDWHNVAGVTVTNETALEVPALWCAVNFIAGSFASLPLQVFTKTDEGRDTADKDSLYPLLHDAPNDEWTSFAWRKYSMINVLANGGRSYTFIEKNLAGRVMNLWPLDPTKTVVKRVGGKKFYEYQDGDRKLTYKASEIIDIPFMLKPDGITHVDPVSKLKGAIGLSIALEQYAQKFFANGGVPPLALYGPVGSPGAAARASADVTKAVKDANAERRNVLIMPTGHELKAVGVDPQKSQMEEARRFQIEEVARIYGLPPVFLQDLTHGTFSNTEQQDLSFVKHLMTQWIEAWEQELNLKLFSARNKTKYVEFNVDGLLRGDFKTRMEGNARAIQTGQLTPNEARAAENRPALDHGDKLYVQGATVPLGSQPVVQAGAAGDDDKPKDKDADAA
jgi:HK97 family phage portal protein